MLFGCVLVTRENRAAYAQLKQGYKFVKSYTWDAQPFGIKNGGKIAIIGSKPLRLYMMYYYLGGACCSQSLPLEVRGMTQRLQDHKNPIMACGMVAFLLTCYKVAQKIKKPQIVIAQK